MRRQSLRLGEDKAYRIYREMGLQVRTTRRKKEASRTRAPLPRPKTIKWSMDFVHDQLTDGRMIRALTIVDHFSRESVAIEVGMGLRAGEVIRTLERLKITRGLPKIIVVDIGSGFSGNEMDRWALENEVGLHFIRPGKLTEYAFIENFNGRLRDECLNANVFYTLEAAQLKIEEWRRDCNDWRPHSSLGNQTFTEYVTALKTGSALEMTRAFQLSSWTDSSRNISGFMINNVGDSKSSGWSAPAVQTAPRVILRRRASKKFFRVDYIQGWKAAMEAAYANRSGPLSVRQDFHRARTHSFRVRCERSPDARQIRFNT